MGDRRECRVKWDFTNRMLGLPAGHWANDGLPPPSRRRRRLSVTRQAAATDAGRQATRANQRRRSPNGGRGAHSVISARDTLVAPQTNSLPLPLEADSGTTCRVPTG